MTTPHVGIALSGGVDSTAAALMLKEHYTVSGFFMQLAQPDIDKQQERVQAVAERLAIPLHTIDLSDAFDHHVLSYFRRSYNNGLTPNPCVVCNVTVKLGLLQEMILEHGMVKMATGHYARLQEKGNSTRLCKGVDAGKDQSYFLCRLTQKQLSRLLFPLGGSTKDAVYDYVEQHGFSFSRSSESQDVCFLKEVRVGEYLQQFTEHAPGAIVDRFGRVMGEHSGIVNYTIGQRRGLGISHASPLYVTAIDAKRNRLVVGEENELVHEVLLVDEIHWLAGSPPALPRQVQVKIRSTHGGDEALLTASGDNQLRLEFNRPQRAPTPGQFAVFYQGDEVLGSGVIVKNEEPAVNAP